MGIQSLFIEVINAHVVIAVLIVLVPYAIFYEIWARKVRGIQVMIPDFLERMAGINRVGLTMAQAIGIMVNTNLGLLSYEIRRIKRDMDWGANFSDALIRFEQRIRYRFNCTYRDPHYKSKRDERSDWGSSRDCCK